MATSAILPLTLLIAAFWPTVSNAQQEGETRAERYRFDIGIIIDNRPLPRSQTAKDEVDLLVAMLDRQMFFEHIIILERPSIEVICDVFGCPRELDPDIAFRPMIWQITRQDQSRLFVYYIGAGRLEGLERQLLFRRTEVDEAVENDRQRGDVIPYSVETLHRRLVDAEPDEAMVMLDAGFAPRPPPCTNEGPHFVSDALLQVRRNYLRIARDHWHLTDNLELAATTPVQASHCDRFDQILEEIEEPLFTKFLLKGIVEGEADQDPFGDEDGTIDLGELTDYLDERIRHAARFQWARRQNVRAVGPPSKVLATIGRRPAQDHNQDLLARRSELSDEDQASDSGDDGSGDGEAGNTDGTRTESNPQTLRERCLADPTAPGCHPCVIDPDGDACEVRCEEERNDSLCAPTLTSDVGTADGIQFSQYSGGVNVTGETTAAGAPASQRSAACRFVADSIAPYAAVLVERIRGSTDPACLWAQDRSEVELGPIGQLFTPVAWRLGRPTAQDAVICLLDCEHIRQPVREAPDDTPVREPVRAPAREADEEVLFVTEADRARDIASRSDFNLFICDELASPLPFSIGIPRWMPGTLMISEGLRAYYGCPPKVTGEPTLPTPRVIAIAPVPPPQPSMACPAGTVSGLRLNRFLRGRPIDETTAALRIDGIPIRDLDIENIDSTLPLERVCIPRKPSGPSRPERPEDEPGGSGETVEIVPTVRLSTSQIHWLQVALTADNRNPGPLDGDLGPRTMAAMNAWRRDNGYGERQGLPAQDEYRDLMRQFGARFRQIHDRVSPVGIVSEGS